MNLSLVNWVVARERRGDITLTLREITRLNDTNLDLLCPNGGALLEAQHLTSVTYGVDETYFLINGSRAGNIAALLSTGQPGEKILLGWALHHSIYTGLILSGAVPVYVESVDHPKIDYCWQ